MKIRLIVLAFVSFWLGLFAPTTETWQLKVYPIFHGPFVVESYTGKCLTYGNGLVETTFDDPPAPAAASTAIYLDDCAVRARSLPGHIPLPLQRIVVREFNGNHDVVLQAGGKVVGVMWNLLAPGVRLELQDLTGATGQIWALDGDSLILKANRNLVIEVKDGRTPRGTPLVLGARDLDDAEFWNFVAVDGTNKKPTSGFVSVSTAAELYYETRDASWGTVIEIAPSVIPLDYVPIEVKAGVTIRGNRRGTRLGPRLTLDSYPERSGMIKITGSHARVTGLRLQGPSRGKDENSYSNGIYVDDRVNHWPIIDHNDMSGWTEAAVHVNYFLDYVPTDLNCDDQSVRPRTVRVARNFLHHNARADLGYGVAIFANGFATIVGNTFLYNRHAIAADGIRRTGYRALFNLVLSDAPEYGTSGITEHDFDMHGTGDDHSGGIAGSDVEVAHNTFLGTDPFGPVNHRNYVVRGIPCAVHRFHDNVSRQSQSEAVLWYSQPSPTAPPPWWMEISNNGFNSPNPTERLGAGDFDGDGRQDLFLATGAAWYYAPAGLTEWRYLNAQTIALADLLFGDLDGDGRTDVVSKQNSDVMVSWAGASKRERINESEGAIVDLALGDFDGDRRADILYTDGSQWLVAYRGTGPFTPLGYPSTLRLRDLRLGDFDGDGRTDVFAVLGAGWHVRYGGNGFWSFLGAGLTTSVANLLIADFDGNGRSDVALSNSSTWRVSLNGTDPWTPLRSGGPISLDQAAVIGAFDATPGADVLSWRFLNFPIDVGTGHLYIIPIGTGDPQRFSRDQMR